MIQITRCIVFKRFLLLILFALEALVYAFEPVEPQIIYDANEIRYLFLTEDKQYLCRSNGDLEVYTGVFEKKRTTFSIGEIKSRDEVLLLEKNGFVKVAMPERGISFSLYNTDTGKMTRQVVIDESKIYDFKIEDEKLYYTSADGYYVYDLQVKTKKRLTSFSAFPIVETVKLGLGNINCILFSELQIVGIDKNAKTSWKKALDANNFCVERHSVQPEWPNCILFYDGLDNKQKIYRCISLLDGTDLWQKIGLPYSSLKGISSNSQYQAWFDRGGLYFTQLPYENILIHVPSVNEEVDVFFDLKDKIAVCIPSLKVTSEDKKELIYSRSSHVLKIIDLNDGSLKNKVSLN